MACPSRRLYDKIWIGNVMARGKYLSLEEARNANQLDQFAKEHPSKTGERFHRLLDAGA